MNVFEWRTGVGYPWPRSLRGRRRITSVITATSARIIRLLPASRAGNFYGNSTPSAARRCVIRTVIFAPPAPPSGSSRRQSFEPVRPHLWSSCALRVRFPAVSRSSVNRKYRRSSPFRCLVTFFFAVFSVFEFRTPFGDPFATGQQYSQRDETGLTGFFNAFFKHKTVSGPPQKPGNGTDEHRNAPGVPPPQPKINAFRYVFNECHVIGVSRGKQIRSILSEVRQKVRS